MLVHTGAHGTSLTSLPRDSYVTVPAFVDPKTDPSKSFPLVDAGLNTLIVDKGTRLRTLLDLFRAMQGVTSGKGRQTEVPVRGFGVSTPAGSVVTWDPVRSKRLFTELREDRPVSEGSGEASR